MTLLITVNKNHVCNVICLNVISKVFISKVFISKVFPDIPRIKEVNSKIFMFYRLGQML
jgi:hypothetical protein